MKINIDILMEDLMDGNYESDKIYGQVLFFCQNKIAKVNNRFWMNCILTNPVNINKQASGGVFLFSHQQQFLYNHSTGWSMLCDVLSNW